MGLGAEENPPATWEPGFPVGIGPPSPGPSKLTLRCLQGSPCLTLACGLQSEGSLTPCGGLCDSNRTLLGLTYCPDRRDPNHKECCVCNLNIPDVGFPFADHTAIHGCALLHEIYHHSDSRDFCSTESERPEEVACAECAAFSLEEGCLISALSHCSDGVTCHNLTDRLDQVRSERTRHCDDCDFYGGNY